MESAGDGEAGDGDGVGVVEGADLGGDLETDGVVGIDGGGEVDLDAIGAELDGYDGGAGATCGLHDGKGKLAAGEEARRLAAEGGEGGFGEDLEDLLLLEVFDLDAEVEFGIEDREVERVGELHRAGGHRGAATLDDVDAELVELGAVDLDDAEFEFHLFAVEGDDLQGVGDVLRVDGGDLRGSVRDLCGRDDAGEGEATLAALHVDGAGWVSLLEGLTKSGGIDVGGDGVEAGSALLIPEDETADAGGFCGDDEFLRARGEAAQHGWVADEDAADGACAVEEKGAADEDVQGLLRGCLADSEAWRLEGSGARWGWLRLDLLQLLSVGGGVGRGTRDQQERTGDGTVRHEQETAHG